MASDVPANDAATSVWASRKVGFFLKATPEADAIRGRNSIGGNSYTLVSRQFNLSGHRDDGDANDLWIVEVSYSEIADYYPGQAFSTQQRTAFAAELFDAEDKLSPQGLIQNMSIASTMVRLTANNVTTRVPVLLQ